MELVAPAGSLEKLKFAYLYGADAAYAGVAGLSLRAQADNLPPSDWPAALAAKGGRKLYGAFNIFFTDPDLVVLERTLEKLPSGLFDAFIVTDPGAVALFRKYSPHTPLHLSTQANCTNSSAALVYRDLGFSRLILARELSLKEIEAVKRNSGLEVEVFVHGAMCLAYSGRCLLSAWLAGRSANRGDCAHACRWEYRVLEEGERPGEYFPVEGGDRFTTILSSKDLCLIDHLSELRDAGVDAVKIEGRMKSVYYTALTARAYRRAIDRLLGKDDADLSAYREELFKVSRREFSTGFLFGREEISKPTLSSYAREYLFVGVIGEREPDGLHRLNVKNRLAAAGEIEYAGFDVPYLVDSEYELFDEHRNRVPFINHDTIAYIKTTKPVKPGYLIRKRM